MVQRRREPFPGGCLLGLLLLLANAQVGYGATLVYEFDGALPADTSLVRPTPAIDAAGALAPPNAPRFVREAVSPGARILGSVPITQRVLAARQLGGQQYTLVRIGNRPSLTTDAPGVDTAPSYIEPHASLVGRYASGAAWGFAQSAEILADGTILIHTTSAGPERRSATLRTSIASFGSAGGHTLVRVGNYPAATSAEATYAPAFFTRTTWLPNLGVEVSCVVEYTTDGLVSAVDPGDGRALGYGSTDGGQTWARVIDTDDPRLGRNLVQVAKHLHHLEPFEWWDPSDGRWKIGVVALLGDGPGAAGQIIARWDGPAFVDPDLGAAPRLERPKVPGKHQLTDLLPIHSSETPTTPLLFLPGGDGASTQQAGMVRSSLLGASQSDALRFQSTISFTSVFGSAPRFNTVPFVFQLGWLGHGGIVAPTWWYGSQGLWISPDLGDAWTTAYLVAHSGFRGALPSGQDRFWTLSSGDNRSTLFQVGLPKAYRSLQLGGTAREVRSSAVFATAPGVSVQDVTGALAGPRALPADARLLRIHSDTLRRHDSFATGPAQVLDAQPGEFVQLVYWIKPVRSDLGVAAFETSLAVHRADGTSIDSGPRRVELGLDDWARVVVGEQVPTGGAPAVSALPRFVLAEAASGDLPLDYYVTEPQIVVSAQPTVQAVRSQTTTAADRLTLALPPLGSTWTIAIWGTEALSFVASLVGSDEGAWVGVEPAQIASPLSLTGERSSLALVTQDGVAGATVEQRIFFPTQDLVVFRMGSDGRVQLSVARGMGELTTLAGPILPGFRPSELRFGSHDWQRAFEGSVHRVKVWTNVGLEAAALEAERTQFAGQSCGLGYELALVLAPWLALRRVRASR